MPLVQQRCLEQKNLRNFPILEKKSRNIWLCVWDSSCTWVKKYDTAVNTAFLIEELLMLMLSYTTTAAWKAKVPTIN